MDGTTLVTPVSVLNKYRLFGLTATLRGEQGEKAIKRLLKDTKIINFDGKVERKINLDVFGGL